MFGIGSLELIIIIGIALFFLKPKDLINAIKSFKQLKNNIQNTINKSGTYINNIIEETELDELKEQSQAILKERTKSYYDEIKSVKKNLKIKDITNLEDTLNKSDTHKK